MLFLKRLSGRFAEEVERAVVAGVVAGVDAVGRVGVGGGPEIGEGVWARVEGSRG